MVNSSRFVFRSMQENLEGLDVLDDFAVRVIFREPYFQFPELLASPLAPIVPEFVVANPEQAESAIGSGPFRLVEYVPEEYLFLERNHDYYRDGLPYMDGIEIFIMPERESRLVGFRLGELDFFGIATNDSLNPDDEREVVSDGNTLYEGRARLNVLWFDTQTPPFNDTRVRRAVAQALDRQLFNEKVHGDPGIPQFPIPPFSSRSGHTPRKLLKMSCDTTQNRPGGS